MEDGASEEDEEGKGNKGQISLSFSPPFGPLNSSTSPTTSLQQTRLLQTHPKTTKLTLVSVLSPFGAAVSSFTSSFLGLGASFFAGAALSGSGALGLSSLGDDDETSLDSLLGSDSVLDDSSVGAAFDAEREKEGGFERKERRGERSA